MDPIGLLIMLAVGAVAGWLAGQIMQGGGFGLLGNILVGIAGSIVAGLLLPAVLMLTGLIGSILSATIGAVIVLFVIGLIKR